jgi:nicotinamidase/pyrazinamidase
MILDQTSDALLVIDVQNDFCPPIHGTGGALAVPGGDAVVPLINVLAKRFDHVLLTQDWHPAGHISFASSHPGAQPYQTIPAPCGPPGEMQTLWPVHCVQGSSGAALHPGLNIPRAELILRKGFRREIDSYSAFLENDHTTPTGLAGYLRERGLKRLFLCGLAYDFCVRFSAIDGMALGFECLVIEDATRAVNLPAAGGAPSSAEATRADFAAAGIRCIQSSEIIGR